MHVAGLFAGIGGLELGLARAGHRCSLLCDVLPTARAVLQSRFPDTEYRHDITTLRSLPGEVDMICAGFPCQDLSQAGQTAGLQGERSGLVGEVFRLLSRRKVSTVVLENVPFMLQLSGGQAIRAIAGEFERRGYRWAYRVVDSYSFGLPQRRERVYFVASRSLDPSAVLFADNHPIRRLATDLSRWPHGFYWTEGVGGLGWAVNAVPTLKNGSTVGIASPPAVLMPDGRIVKPSIRAAECLQGFEADWTLPAESVAKPSLRWGLVGSAVSVPVAGWLGRRLAVPGGYDGLRMGPFAGHGRAPRAARYDGKHRFAVDIGVDPLGIAPSSLADVLAENGPSELLSEKATLGFLRRTRRARLRFPLGFIGAVERHLEAMGGTVPARAQTAQMELLEA